MSSQYGDRGLKIYIVYENHESFSTSTLFKQTKTKEELHIEDSFLMTDVTCYIIIRVKVKLVRVRG